MRIGWLVLVASFASVLSSTAVSARDVIESEPSPPPTPQATECEPLAVVEDVLKDNPLGSFYLRVRPRFEFADQKGRNESYALTARTVVGFGSRSFRGFSVLAEGESVLTPANRLYFDGVERSSRRTLVADPESLEVNQAYLDYQNATWANLGVRVGRQRMQIDDERFIGNVGWRQNEMTMDAARIASSLGVPDLMASYAYIAYARRPFGDRGGKATRDFESNSHLARLSYARFPLLRLKLFAYILDFDDAAKPLSSRTFGSRLEGERAFGGEYRFGYVLSYAHQLGDDRNYDNSYQLARTTLEHEVWGGLTLGFERLGSDDGKDGFTTPLATSHGFNGYADAFVDNGGRRGLRDYFVELTPELPARFAGSAALHWFEADHGGDGLGWEVDAVVSRPLTSWATVLLKGAYFDGRSRARPSRVRAWLQFSFSY